MSFFDKLSHILISPMSSLSNWVEEPLKRSAHARQEESKDRDVQREINKQVGVERALSEQKMKEMQLSSQLDVERQRILSEQRMQESEFAENLKIKRETEIIRILTEIEQLKKDKEFERMKSVSDAMMQYQTELTRINVEAVEAIGSMRIELQRRAYELIHEKTEQYSELQNRALQQADEQLKKIDNNPDMSERSRNIMHNAVEEKLAGIIKNATRFIDQLNDDMQLISKDINLITSSGQKFIEGHLAQFQLIGLSSNEATVLLSSDSLNK